MKFNFKPIRMGFCCLLLLFSITGCTLTNRNSDTAESSASAVNSSTDTNGKKATLNDIFPKDKVIDVKITIDEADFQDMLDNASKEEYKEASVNYNGYQFDHVGIRTKGNLSLRSVVSSDSDRYSFKLSFDEYINQQLGGIRKINLNNNYSDASYMREFLTYELAESVGLPTPGFSYVNVYVNDELWGFYLAIEQVDEAYLNRNFGNATGALYKGEMTGVGSDLTWLGDDPDSYTGLAMKSEKSNDDILIDMLDELNNGSDYEKVLNVENALKYIALNVAASNMDSYLGSNKQNYYLYEDDGIFNILPWDYNMAFGGFGGTNILIDEPTQGAVAERPLVAKLLAVEAYKEQYHQILSEMINGYLKEENITARIKELQELISTHVKNDPRPFYTYEQYEQALPTLTSFITSNNESISKQLDGTSPSSGDGSGSGGGMGGPGGGGDRGMGREMRQNDSTTTGDNSTNTSNVGDQNQVPMNSGDTEVNGQATPPTPPEDMPTNTPGIPSNGAPQMPSTTDQTESESSQNGQQNNPPDQNGGAGMNPGQMGGKMPEGGFGGGGGFRPDGFGREGANEQGSSREVLYTGVSLLLLILSTLFVTLYKRKRL